VTARLESAIVPPDPGVPPCGPDDHCITCGDVAVAMRVERVDAAARLAWCVPAGAAAAPGVGEWVDPELVGAVRPGDVVLVHAATALARLDAVGAPA
jgi:hypothetical protein